MKKRDETVRATLRPLVERLIGLPGGSSEVVATRQKIMQATYWSAS